MASSASKGVYLSQLGNAVRRAAAVTTLETPGITPTSSRTAPAPTRPPLDAGGQGGTTGAKSSSAAPPLPSPQQVDGRTPPPVPAASTQRVQPPDARPLPSSNTLAPRSPHCPPVGGRSPAAHDAGTRMGAPLAHGERSIPEHGLRSAGAGLEGPADKLSGVAASDDARTRELFAQAQADVARAGGPGAGDAEVAAAVAALDQLGSCRVSVDLLRETRMGRLLKQMSKSCVPAVAHAAAEVVAAFKKSLVGEGR
jgi:hypothetical protein